MKLWEIAEIVDGEIFGDRDVEVSEICNDTQKMGDWKKMVTARYMPQ